MVVGLVVVVVGLVAVAVVELAVALGAAADRTAAVVGDLVALAD